MKIKLIVLFMLIFNIDCFSEMARNHTIQLASQDWNCPSNNISVISEIFGEGQETSYSLNVCGVTRRYRFIRSPITGTGQMEYVDNLNRNNQLSLNSICDSGITVHGDYAMTIFYLDGGEYGRCINHYSEQGWRIVSTRRAHNGNIHTGWGQEAVLQREREYSIRATNSAITNSEQRLSPIDGTPPEGTITGTNPIIIRIPTQDRQRFRIRGTINTPELPLIIAFSSFNSAPTQLAQCRQLDFLVDGSLSTYPNARYQSEPYGTEIIETVFASIPLSAVETMSRAMDLRGRVCNISFTFTPQQLETMRTFVSRYSSARP